MSSYPKNGYPKNSYPKSDSPKNDYPKMDNLKAIFFDLDDTLIDHAKSERQALMHMFNNIGVDYKESYQDVFRPLDFALWNDTYDESVPKEKIPVYRFSRLFELIDIEYDNPTRANELFQKKFAETGTLLNYAEETVKYINSKGLQVCIVTNGAVALQNPRILNSPIGKYITHVMVSEGVGVKKPDPIIFNLLLKKLNMSAKEVVMVGDSLTNDIQGAKNAGIKSIWYNPNRTENKTNILPDYEINDLREIKKII